jgi:4-hydroxy-tetrahydrodipicolinate reductase
MRALIVGYGKMGKAIEAELKRRGHTIVGEFGGREEGDKQFIPSSSSDLPSCDIAFEFTAPEGAPRLVPLLLSKRIPVLSGTTGWDTSEAARRATELSVPFLHSANFSLGVAATRRAAAALGAALAPFREFHPGIVERHHSAKRDAPSGTAKALAADVAHASGRRDVPVVSLRQGGVPGEHALYFEGEDETVELVHRARSRAIFAQGAVRAAEWMLASGRKGPLSFDEFFSEASRRGDAS